MTARIAPKRIRDQQDFGATLGSGVNGYAIVYDHDTGQFVLAAFDPAGTASQLMSSHLGDSNPHSQYLLASGATPGATAQAQAFSQGVITGKLYPASNSTNAFGLYRANGTTQDFWYDSTNGRIGIGAAPGAFALSIAGAGRFTSTVQLDAQPGADNHAITRGYSISKLMNLVVNGSGLLGNNYNFSGFTFDATETHGGGGSFKTATGTQQFQNNEYIPVDPDKYYRLVTWSKSGNADGSQYNSSARFYIGCMLYDADKLEIRRDFVTRHAGSTDTTLASPLNPGDTAMILMDATGWNNSANFNYSRQIVWWPYTNSFGYTYPDYTYSRNSSFFLPGAYSASGMWAAGGISGNTITLTAPWPGPALPAGTAVRNSFGGDSGGRYFALINAAVGTSWTRNEGTIGSVSPAGTISTNTFAPGTAYVKLYFLNNYNVSTDQNVIRHSDIWFSEMSSRNLEPASATVPGVVALGDQQLGTGIKFVPDRFGVGFTATANITALLTIAASTTARASLRIAAGTRPTAPTSGDLWNDGALTAFQSSVNTASVANSLKLERSSSGTPAPGFGLGIAAQLKSSTTEAQEAGRLIFKWGNPTNAVRSGIGQLSALYITTEHTPVTWGADSSGALLGFYDVTTPIARQVLATGVSATVDDVIAALQNLGLVKQS